MNTPSSNTQNSPDSGLLSTREKILDAAEALIIEHGFAGTSLRAISSRADVNLAATNYHFGSKQGLLAAVFHRRIKPISEARLQALDKLEADDEPIAVEAIVAAFLEPLYSVSASQNHLHVLPSLVGRIYGEPESLTKPMLEQEFTEVAQRFIQALSSALPDVPVVELQWRLHFMIGAMIQLLRFQAPLNMKASNKLFISGLDNLCSFTAAGFQQLTQQPASPVHRSTNQTDNKRRTT